MPKRGYDDVIDPTGDDEQDAERDASAKRARSALVLQRLHDRKLAQAALDGGMSVALAKKMTHAQVVETVQEPRVVNIMCRLLKGISRLVQQPTREPCPLSFTLAEGEAQMPDEARMRPFLDAYVFAYHAADAFAAPTWCILETTLHDAALAMLEVFDPFARMLSMPRRKLDGTPQWTGGLNGQGYTRDLGAATQKARALPRLADAYIAAFNANME